VAPGRRPRLLTFALFAGLLLTAALVMYRLGRTRIVGSDAALDTTHYAILPFEYQPGTPSLNEEQLLHDALSRWSGLTVVDHFQLRDAMERKAAGPATMADAMDLARFLNAGRFVRGEVSRGGDSLRVRAALYDASAGGRQLSDVHIKVPSTLAGVDSLFQNLANQLLLRKDAPLSTGAFIGTHSLPARQAFARGQLAIQTWDLAAADSAFELATTHDASYGEAHLWLALVRAWSGGEAARWLYSAERAASLRASLPVRDQAIADALVAEGRGDFERACPLWKRLTLENPGDFAAWYGSANCQAGDDAVVRDPRTRSGFRVRTSYHSALAAFKRSFELLPPILSAHRSDSYQSLRVLLRTGPDDLRSGAGVGPDTSHYDAYPEWAGDSLVYIPHPARSLAGLQPETIPATLDEAVRHQRQMFYDVAVAWRTAAPRNPDALQALSLALEMLGDPSALDTLLAARRLVTQRDEGVRIAGAEVWLRIKFSLPNDTAGLRLAKRLVDSLVRQNPPGTRENANVLAGLAALTGRAVLVGQYVRSPQVWRVAPSPALARAGPALIAFASLGGESDSLDQLEEEVANAIAGMAPSQRRANELEWLGRAGTLAFPDKMMTSIRRLAGKGDYVVDLIADLMRGDTLAVRRALDTIRLRRKDLDPSGITFDNLYPEASALRLIGDPQASADWLDPALSSLRRTAPQVFETPARAGTLMRSVALRSELAWQLGDSTTARRWGRALQILWADADPFLRTRLERLRPGRP
jgi:hypothetical protein